jgi:hypothetical protein
LEKRKIVIGDYDTAFDGLWTLTGLEFSASKMASYCVDVPGRKAGPLDLSTALTDGEPTYGSRTLIATLESSEGTYLEREERISSMINALDGERLDIVLPDDPEHYLVGRVSVAREFNNLAHARVTVTAICEPWRYSFMERVYTFTAESTAIATTLFNGGRLAVVPLLTVTGAGASVSLVYGSASWVLGPGTYKLPDMVLKKGNASLTYSGTGTVRISFREGVL